MKQYVCSICSYTYDESKGIPEAGIPPGTRWEDLPEDWTCPWCGAVKDLFVPKETEPRQAAPQPAAQQAAPPQPEFHAERELSPMEMSIICSNLARGCEKQYLPQQAEAFARLAAFFRQQAKPVPQPNMEELLRLIEQDLSDYPEASAVFGAAGDRGALRCQVWSEKVTRMLQSLLARYRQQGEKMLQNTGVYVCTICGFVYIGDAPPELCPVCKVPAWKFEKIEGRAG